MKDIIKQGYIGNPAQLVTLRRVTVSEGKAKGTEIIEVKTAGGLELDILPDAGLDIGQCRYRGINMSWMSKNGYDSPAAINPYETEFVNTFPGGLLYTCGLRSAGPANRDKGEWHPLHGRYHSLQAEQVCAEIVDDEIIVKGTIRETALFGHVLEVKRTIRIPVFGTSVTVQDTVTNQTPRDEEIMQIYHCNFGYPLLSEKARLILPEERETVPRTDFAKTGLGRECTFDKPIPGEEERVFFQKMKEEFSARLENPELGVNMTISWSGDTLPILSQWRSMASGDYVLGLEPTNCYIMGRHDERENGTLPVLKAWESLTNTVNITFTED
ncbi:MAG: aldose 1-epimerase family protein [Oscillospiraceae bacterium]|nr:aldose 1-epimerase family protein [Oscillospiraceae bacterium]